MVDEAKPTPSDDYSIRVLLCDDHTMFRRNLLIALERDRSIEVIAEVETGDQVAAAAAEHVPDVILLSLGLKGPPAGELITSISDQLPSAHLVVMSAQADDPDILDALGAGAIAQVTKESGFDRFATIVHAADRGEAVIEAKTASLLRERLTRSQQDSVPLSPPEVDVLTRLADGLDEEATGAALDVPASVVRRHVSNAIRKLHLGTRLDRAGPNGSAAVAPPQGLERPPR